jgi:hypothetical protein
MSSHPSPMLGKLRRLSGCEERTLAGSPSGALFSQLDATAKPIEADGGHVAGARSGSALG